jgi:predicted 2-oxoglutarate/Fe(II)-dependent dioxygenase YbiX
MADGASFSVELLHQSAESGLDPADPLSWGTMRLVMAGVEIWNDDANLTSTSLCLLRTTRSDFVGPLGGVSDTNPLIHHCGLLPEMGCPIGASWRVQHVGDEVHIDSVVRASQIGSDEPVEGLPSPFIINRTLYADQIRAFATAVRAGLEREPGRYTKRGDPALAPIFEQFWAEYTMLLSSRTLIATELTAARIEEMLDSSSTTVVEATPGLFLIQICDTEENAALIARVDRASWLDATINADRSIDRSVRDADVLDERAHADLFDDLRELLAEATAELAADLVPGAVLAEVQLVRYQPGGHYLDHRDTPAIGATPRTLSLVWYLNDGFTGGETRFVSPDISVSPVSGVAIAFSPVLMHRAEPVIAGTKYAVVAWYLSGAGPDRPGRL